MICCQSVQHISSTQEKIINEKKQRGIIGTKRFCKGELIESNRSIAHSLRSKYWDERCSSCLKQNSQLKCCSKCKLVKYCSKDCQTRSWSIHKVTCNHISSLTSEFNQDDIDDLLIMMAILSQISSSKCHWECFFDESNKYVCGQKHSLQMSTGGGTFNDNAIEIISRVCELTKSKIEIAASIYSCCRSNNFGITDDLMNCIAIAVFPRTALLNHSCEPNCIIRYELTAVSNDGPIAHLIALRDIEEGEELTHSYCDSTYPNAIRQISLQNIYGFTCQCNACIQPVMQVMEITTAKTDIDKLKALKSKPIQLLKLMKDMCSRIGQHQMYRMIEYLQTEIYSPQSEFLDLVNKANMHVSHMDKLSLSIDDIGEDSTKDLDECIIVLEDICGPFNFDLYQIRCRILNHYLLAGNPNKAFELCKLLVGHLMIALVTRFPFHPLLGLQLFTLGDLATESSFVEEAMGYYTCAEEMAILSHGRDAPICRRLALILLEHVKK